MERDPARLYFFLGSRQVLGKQVVAAAGPTTFNPTDGRPFPRKGTWERLGIVCWRHPGNGGLSAGTDLGGYVLRWLRCLADFSPEKPDK